MVHSHANRRDFLRLGASAFLLAGCSRDQRTLRAADNQPADYPTVKAIEHFGAELAESTDGRISLDVYSGGQLGAQNDVLEIAQFGGIDFIRINTAPLNVIVPETLIPSLPFIFNSIAHMRRAMDGPPGKQILASLAPHGLIGLCFYDSGARSIYTTKRLIQEPADLKGYKIRVQTSDLFVSMIDALGGDATPMSYGEVYQALVQGVIDGAENNWPSFESSRHFEVAPYYSLTRHVMAPEVLAMSARRWSRLSDEDQDRIGRAALSSVGVMRRLWDARVEKAMASVKKAGVTVTDEIDLQAFQSKVAPVWEKYLSTPHLNRLAQDIQSLGEQSA